MFKKAFVLLGITLSLLTARCSKADGPKLSLRLQSNTENDCVSFEGNRVTTGPWKNSGTNICVWDTHGSLQHVLTAQYLFPEPNGPMTTNTIGLLPKDQTSLYVLMAGGDYSMKNYLCTLEVIDLKNPSRHVSIPFDPHAPVELDCSSGFTEGELDLGEFTFDHPQFRFRVKQHSFTNYNNIESVGEWQTIRQ